MNRELESAASEARSNPQAYACLGITLFSGLVGVFSGVLLIDKFLRISIVSICFVLLVAGIVGHSHFKKRESKEGFRPSSKARRFVGYGFALSLILALAFVVFAVAHGDLIDTVFPIAYAIAMFPFVRRLLASDARG